MKTGLYTKKELGSIVMKLIDAEFPLCKVKGPYLDPDGKKIVGDIDYNKFKKEGYYRKFKSPKWTWENLCGREGYILVYIKEDNKCEIINTQLTSMS